MKFIVGILAAALLAGCGVGVDDPEGQAAAGITWATSTQALGAGGYTDPGPGTPGTPPPAAPTPAAPADLGIVPSLAGSSTIGGGGGGSVSAPQDPIPAFERKTNVSNPVSGN